MKYKFGAQSRNRLNDVHPMLVAVVERVMSYQIMDFSVIEGMRSHARQKQLFDQGASKTMKSYHLIQPDGYSHAVDLYPHPINMFAVNDRNNGKHAQEIFRFGVLAGLMRRAAQELNVTITNGADWDRDGETLDHSFFDAPHFQIETGDKK